MQHWHTFILLFAFSLLTFSCTETSPPAPKKKRISYGHDLNNVRLSVVESGTPKKLTIPKEKKVTYSIKYPTFLNPKVLNEQVKASFDQWKEHIHFHFVQVPYPSGVILISFEAPEHRDSCDAGFRNPSFTIAHAFDRTYVCLAGVIHLNNKHKWVLNGSHTGVREGRYDLQTVLVHEIGHVLGLSHIEPKRAVMHEAYLGLKRQLSKIDIRNIRHLYKK